MRTVKTFVSAGTGHHWPLLEGTEEEALAVLEQHGYVLPLGLGPVSIITEGGTAVVCDYRNLPHSPVAWAISIEDWDERPVLRFNVPK